MKQVASFDARAPGLVRAGLLVVAGDALPSSASAQTRPTKPDISGAAPPRSGDHARAG
jgi:hypothetical protein